MADKAHHIPVAQSLAAWQSLYTHTPLPDPGLPTVACQELPSPTVMVQGCHHGVWTQIDSNSVVTGSRKSACVVTLVICLKMEKDMDSQTCGLFDWVGAGGKQMEIPERGGLV